MLDRRAKRRNFVPGVIPDASPIYPSTDWNMSDSDDSSDWAPSNGEFHLSFAASYSLDLLQDRPPNPCG